MIQGKCIKIIPLKAKGNDHERPHRELDFRFIPRHPRHCLSPYNYFPCRQAFPGIMHGLPLVLTSGETTGAFNIPYSVAAQCALLLGRWEHVTILCSFLCLFLLLITGSLLFYFLFFFVLFCSVFVLVYKSYSGRNT